MRSRFTHMVTSSTYSYHSFGFRSRWIVIVCERVNVARLATCMAYESKELYDVTELGM